MSDSIGTVPQVLRRIGLRGIAKTLYHSYKISNSTHSLLVNRNVIMEVDEETNFSLDGIFFLGSISPRESHPTLRRSLFSTGPEASIETTGGKPRAASGFIMRIEGDFTLGSSFINDGVRMICEDEITIGDGVSIGWETTIMDTDRHQLIVEGREPEITAPISIEDDVWIGHNSSVLKGVTIGEGAVIASNSVVTDDVPPNTLVAGNPATIIREDIDWIS